jgi:hypothetical protein
LTLTTACACRLTPPRSQTGFREKERLKLILEREGDYPRDPIKPGAALEPLLAATLAPVAAWLAGELIGMVEKAISREQREHLGTYSSRLVIPDFHAKTKSLQPSEGAGDVDIADDGRRGRIQKIILERTASPSPQKDPEAASRIVLGVKTETWSEKGPGVAMRFELLHADVLRSKAKVTQAVWYNPFSYCQRQDSAWWKVWLWWADNQEPLIRLEVSINAEALWFNGQRAEKVFLGDTTFICSGLPVGRTGALERQSLTFQGPWMPIVPWAIVDPENPAHASLPSRPGLWGMEEASIKSLSKESPALAQGKHAIVSGLLLLSLSVFEIDENSSNFEQFSKVIRSIRESVPRAVEKKLKEG